MEKNALNLPVFTWKDSPDLKNQEKYAQYIISTNITYTHLHAHTCRCLFLHRNKFLLNIISVIHGANVERGKTFTVYFIYL